MPDVIGIPPALGGDTSRQVGMGDQTVGFAGGRLQKVRNGYIQRSSQPQNRIGQDGVTTGKRVERIAAYARTLQRLADAGTARGTDPLDFL